ncbi:YoaK family protein [Kineococcus gynurae]|uniref:YoaK family protein n=1 Tax=Kineococcus gynurae TaxID=452979 RepID=A0ABV5LSR1_9ACTN
MPRRPREPRPASSVDRWHLALMLVLTFSTGIVDAVGYLGLDRVFTANMTGNVVILGMALVGADDLPILGPVVALVGFLLGAFTAGRTLRRAAVGWTTGKTVLLLLVGVVMAGLALFTGTLGDSVPVTPGSHPPPAALAVTGVLGLIMGVQAAAARRLSVKDVTTVVVTSTLTGLAADSRLAGGDGKHWPRRAGAVLLIGAGAAVGALLLRWHIGSGLGLAAIITVVVAVLGHVTVRVRPEARESVEQGV